MQCLLRFFICSSQICKLALGSRQESNRESSIYRNSHKIDWLLEECVIVLLGLMYTMQDDANDITHTHAGVFSHQTTSRSSILLKVYPHIDARREVRRRIGFPLCLDRSVHKSNLPPSRFDFSAFYQSPTSDNYRALAQCCCSHQKQCAVLSCDKVKLSWSNELTQASPNSAGPHTLKQNHNNNKQLQYDVWTPEPSATTIICLQSQAPKLHWF